MGGGGAERQLAYLAGGLVLRGWEVHVALLVGGPYLRRLEGSGAMIHVMQVAHNYDPRMLLRIARLIDSVRPAVVQSWMPLMDIAAGFVSSMKGVPWLLSERSSNQDYLSPAKRLLRTFSARRATVIVSNSAAGERYWAARIPSGRRFVIENALQLEEMDDVPAAGQRSLPGTSAAHLIVAAGRYDPGKNYGTLVEALRIVARQRDVRALFCGEGPAEPAIRAAIGRAGLGDRVVLAGFRHDIWGVMKAADLYISISHFEGRANTVMEAAACGLPLVLSDIPEHREMFGEDAAWFVDRNDPAAVARAIDEALNDPEQGNARARVAMRAARRWTVEAMTARYEAVYEELAGKN
jgi:glycosyltransferase involved in cell wall biosynthesis